MEQIKNNLLMDIQKAYSLIQSLYHWGVAKW